MKITLNEIPVKDVFTGYEDKGEDGVLGYGGMLDIRPAYQRELVYSEEQMRAVIKTVLNGFPLNVMYWVDRKDGSYEVLDGQQRTLSIMHFLDHKFTININGHDYYYDGLPEDLYNKIVDYKLMVYICEGNASEKLEWFKTVNIAGVKLTNQELRNSVHTGNWLTDAKRHFSKRNCAAYQLSNKYINGDPIRQELLEQALKGISELQGKSIEGYMSEHQNDEDCDELWRYYQDAIHWIQVTFTTYDKNMKGLDWLSFYNKYKDNTYNSTQIKSKVKALQDDYEVMKKKGIYEYILSGKEKYLHIREFPEPIKKAVYAEQRGICPLCGKYFEYGEMHGDHIKPWSQGGTSQKENCQMLCHDCNWTKSNH